MFQEVIAMCISKLFENYIRNERIRWLCPFVNRHQESLWVHEASVNYSGPRMCTSTSAKSLVTQKILYSSSSSKLLKRNERSDRWQHRVIFKTSIISCQTRARKSVEIDFRLRKAYQMLRVSSWEYFQVEFVFTSDSRMFTRYIQETQSVVQNSEEISKGC